VAVWHKYHGSSVYDETAAAKRLCREHGPFDVSIVCDKHAPAASVEMKYGDRLRAFLRGGTAKLNDPYGKSLGYQNSLLTWPSVILWPDERRVWATADLAGALDYIERLHDDPDC
jgi:hypothetical protein